MTTTASVPPSLQVSVPVGWEQRRAASDGIRRAIAEDWLRYGLGEPPVVDLVENSAASIGGTSFAAVPLLLSARRRQQIVEAATGGFAGRHDPDEVGLLGQQRWAAATEDERRHWVIETARASVACNLPLLLDRLAGNVLQAAALPIGHGQQERARQLLVLLARLNLAPADYDVHAIADCAAVPDPYLGCEQLLSTAADRSQAYLEMNRATLRRVSTHRHLAQSWGQTVMVNASLDNIYTVRTTLWNAYGVATPEVRLRAADDLPDRCFRLVLGRHPTPVHRLLPEDVLVVPQPERSGMTAPPLGSFVDPVTGARWPVLPVDEIAANLHPRTPCYDTVSMIMRTIYAEARRQLAAWSPDELPAADHCWYLRGELAEQVAGRLPVTTRWLLADGAPVSQAAPIGEAILRQLAIGGGEDVETLIEAARACLGGAVVGQLPRDDAGCVVVLDDAAVDRAVRTADPGVLLARHPELISSTRSILAVCATVSRPTLANLLRPLNDVVLVVGDTEIQNAALTLPSLAH